MTRSQQTLAAAALVAAAAHVPGIAEHLEEAPYMGVLFAAFTGACLVLAAAVLVRPGRAVYAVAATLCGTAVATYAATRLTAFPQLADDVGNWGEPLGLVSIAAETLVVLTALYALRRRAATA